MEAANEVVMEPVSKAAVEDSTMASKINQHEQSEEEEAVVVDGTTVTTDGHGNVGGCCQWSQYDGNVTAQGYSIHGVGRGPIYMASVFLSTAFIYLASDQVGCVQVVDEQTGETEIIEDCNERVYGAFSPAALVTNIATISGVLMALFLPIIGAIIDFTPHRWTVGVVSAILLILTEVVQIFTNAQTWFYMAILEALSAFIFEVQILASLAYLADIARQVGEETMNTNTALFLMVEVSSQVIFVFVIVAVSIILGLGDIPTAQVGQALCAVVSGLGFYLAWRKFPNVPAKHSIHTDEEIVEHDDKEEVREQRPNLLVAGFVQNWNTFQRINRQYKKSLRWFLLATIFAEAAGNAYISVAVIFLTEHLGLNTTEVGIFFVISLIAIVLACRAGEIITTWTNPNISWRLSMLYVFVITLVGALTLNRNNANPYVYVWGFICNLGLGWYYQTEYLYMSMVTPKNQEAEFAGFFNYCRLILVWLPPLLFSLLVEAGVSLSIGVIVTLLFFLIAIGFLSMSASWDEVLQEVHKQPQPQQHMLLEPTEFNNDALAIKEEQEKDLSKVPAEPDVVPLQVTESQA